MLLKPDFFLVPRVGEKGLMRVKSRDFQKAHLGPLLNVHIIFQLPSPVWRGDRGETALFEVKKDEIPISPLLLDLGR